MEALKELCGCSPGGTRIGAIQNILGKDIVRYGQAVAGMMASDAPENMISLYGCFAARKLMEAGCISVLSRLDPGRLLILREFQLKGGYPLGERHSASLDWKTDVVSEKKATWTDTISPDKFIRSLLGGHLAEVMWVHAVQNFATLADSIPNISTSRWINELVNQYETRRSAVPNGTEGHDDAESKGSAELGVLASFRTAAQQSFSTLSKGVHLEFVVDQDALFDLVTVRQSMLLAVKTLAQLAFTSHLIDSAFTKLNPEVAFELVVAVETEIERDA